MTDDPGRTSPRDPTEPLRPTSREPIRPDTRGTEPFAPPPRYGGSPPLRPSRRPAGLPGKLLAVIGGVVLVLFLLGYLAGRATAPEPPAPAQQEVARGGGGAACRRALDLSLQVNELQRQALANRTQFTQAALSGDQEAMATLNEALGPISQQLQQAQGRLGETVVKCRSRQAAGGKGKGKGKGGGEG